MPPRDTNIMCALSGLVPSDPEYEAVADEDEEGDDMAGVPANWTRITLSRRVLNPEWVDLQHAKREAVRNTLLQVPKTERAAFRPSAELQVRAFYAALDDRIPRYLLDEEIVFLAPPERSPDLAKAIGDLFQHLGVTALALSPEMIEDEEDEGEDETPAVEPVEPTVPPDETPAVEPPTEP